MKVRRKRPPTTAAPQFLNERELVEPQKSLVFQVNNDNDDDNAVTTFEYLADIAKIVNIAEKIEVPQQCHRHSFPGLRPWVISVFIWISVLILSVTGCHSTKRQGIVM